MTDSADFSFKLSPNRLAMLTAMAVLATLVCQLSTFSRLSHASQFQLASDFATPADAPAKTDAPEKLLREGSSIEKMSVTCRASGDILQMEFSEFGRRMAALQNLASQRILKAVIEDSHDTAWVVSGTVTEFKGRNYLLITRAERGAASDASPSSAL